ncbi:hypothetical protein [Streptomyces sp. CoH27]|uniref:hypothetical protein n=1 Tax=Streptomyces sp. CoH27 TaxID=2875763 RepID=UPI001CD55CA2|nr:hypothetical protein [Streptomyces sp. CoH27]
MSFWTHVNPSGRFELDTNAHLDPCAAAGATTVPGPRIAPAAPAAQPVRGTAGLV